MATPQNITSRGNSTPATAIQPADQIVKGLRMNDRDTVEIVYTNYRGETSRRRILPLTLHFEASPWHWEPQWVLHAFDCDKHALRYFAMRDIHSWAQASLAPITCDAPDDAKTPEDLDDDIPDNCDDMPDNCNVITCPSLARRAQ